jgi:hypothetical protein
MKALHLSALACFALALVFYLLALVPGMLLLGVLGLGFEAAAWIKLFSRERIK